MNLLSPAAAPFINLKKIKDHWINVLNPAIDNSPFLAEEDAWLIANAKEKGN